MPSPALSPRSLTAPGRGPYSGTVGLASLGGLFMPHFRSLPPLAAVSALALSCKTSHAYDRTNDPGGRPLSRTTTGSVVCQGRALTPDTRRTPLDTIRDARSRPHHSAGASDTR